MQVDEPRGPCCGESSWAGSAHATHVRANLQASTVVSTVYGVVKAVFVDLPPGEPLAYVVYVGRSVCEKNMLGMCCSRTGSVVLPWLELVVWAYTIRHGNASVSHEMPSMASDHAQSAHLLPHHRPHFGQHIETGYGTASPAHTLHRGVGPVVQRKGGGGGGGAVPEDQQPLLRSVVTTNGAAAAHRAPAHTINGYALLHHQSVGPCSQVTIGTWHRSFRTARAMVMNSEHLQVGWASYAHGLLVMLMQC
jgi:hypothetical protein